MPAPAWARVRASRCSLCGGKGWYMAAYPFRRIDPCPRCNGTGHR